MKTKTALITGGSRGLGRNMAIALAKKGLNVIITYKNRKDQADEVVTEVQSLGQKAVSFELDTGNVSLFDDFLQQVSSYLKKENGDPNFDYLINNAGIGLIARVTETSEEQLEEIFNIHYKGVFFLTQKSLPFINDGGAIINLSSGLARTTVANASVYASMKGAIEIFTRYLAKELGPRKIRVNAIAPGAIETDFDGGTVRDNQEANARIASFTALGRVGQTDDIGSVVAFLCSQEAYWINGQRIEVSGGQAL